MNHSGCRRMTKLLCIFWNYPSVTRIIDMGGAWMLIGGLMRRGTNELGANEFKQSCGVRLFLGPIKWGTNEMGDLWVGDPIRCGTNGLGSAWVLTGGGGGWNGWPMRRGTNEMGYQWRAPTPPCIRMVMFKMLCHDHKCIPMSSRCIPDEFFGDIGRRPEDVRPVAGWNLGIGRGIGSF